MTDTPAAPAAPVTDRVAALTLLLPFIGCTVTLLAFFPGSIDYDYGVTITEARTLTFSGHQAPLAAIVLRLVSPLGGFVAPMFVLKVTAAYGAVAFAMYRSDGVWRRLLIFAAICGPVFLILTPSLRLSYIASSFVALALSLGLFGRSRRSLTLALAALLWASLFSSGFDLGYLFTVLTIVLARRVTGAAGGGGGGGLGRAMLRGLGLGAGLLAVSKTVGLGLLTAYGAAGIDRSSTLYVSMLNDLAGMQAMGVDTCVSSEMTEGGVDPSAVLVQYAPGVVKTVIWGTGPNFVFPPTERELAVVSACWRTQLVATPGPYLRYKAAFLKSTLFSNGWFVGFFTEGKRRDNAVTAQALRMLEWTVEAKLARLPGYIMVTLVAAAVLAWRAGISALVVTIAGCTAALGYLAPHIVFGQEPISRYTVNSSQLLLWLTSWQLTVALPARRA